MFPNPKILNVAWDENGDRFTVGLITLNTIELKKIIPNNAGNNLHALLIQKVLIACLAFFELMASIISGVTTNPEITKKESTPRYPFENLSELK